MGISSDLTGQKIHQLKVIEFDQTSKGSRQGKRWLCECLICNQIVSIPVTRLKNGENTDCGKHKAQKLWKGCGDISGSYWLQIKHRCILKNREFSITIEEAWDLFLKQNRRCALTGRPLVFISNYSSTSRAQTASLDRIDSNIGYTLENCCWVHKVVNKMKHTVHSDEFIKTCQEVTEHQKYLKTTKDLNQKPYPIKGTE